jgi:hypothetical protein
MAQYRTGTVSVTNGDATVTGVDTEWLANVGPGDFFRVTGDIVGYEIASVTNDLSLELTSTYAGSTASGLGYQITIDFTPTLDLPLITAGDLGTDVLWNRAMQIIDTTALGGFPAIQTDAITELTLDNGVLIEGNLHKDSGITVRSGQSEAWLLDYYNNTTDPAIGGLTGGTNFGGIIRAPANGHFVIGIREDEATDSFSIISGNGDYSGDVTYDKLVAQFKADGEHLINGIVKMSSASTGDNLLLESTDAGAAQGPNMVLYRNSASPLASDNTGAVVFRGVNSLDADIDYALIHSTILDPTNASEDAQLDFDVYAAGSSSTVLALTGTQSTFNTDLDILNAGLTVGGSGADYRAIVQSNTTFQIGAQNASGNSAYFGATSDASPDAVISNNAGTEIARFGNDLNSIFAGNATAQRLIVELAGNAIVETYDTTTGVAASTRTVGVWEAYGASTTDVKRTFGSLTFDSTDATNLSEDGRLTLRLMQAGTLTSQVVFDNSQISLQDNNLLDVGNVTKSTAFFERDINTDKMTISGGNTSVVGGVLNLYGGAHASQANDIELLANNVVRVRWDNSASAWDFLTNLITGVSDIGRGTTTGSMFMSGGSTLNQGGNIVLFAESHATNPGDIRFRSGTSVKMFYNDTLGEWGFNTTPLNSVGNITMSDREFLRSVDTDNLIISGGTATNTGSNLTLYGSTHATLADDIRFRASAATVLTWDNSETEWNFQGQKVTRVGPGNAVALEIGADSTGSGITDATQKISRVATPHYTNAEEPMALFMGTANISSNVLNIGGGTSQMNAATEVNLYTGATSTTVTGTQQWQVNASGSLIGVGGSVVRRSVTNSSLTMSGGNAGSSGANITLNGNTATDANDIRFRADSTIVLLWDDSVSSWDFQNNAIVNPSEIQIGDNERIIRNGATGLLTVSGGSVQDNGGNIRLWGESHASQAGDIQLRTNTSIRLHWDDSANNWDFRDNNLVGLGDLTMFGNDINREAATDLLRLSGGTAFNLGGAVFLYGESHVSKANDLEFLTNNSIRLNWDNSASEWNFQSNVVTGIDQLFRGTSADNLNITGGGTTSLGGGIVLYGESHATQAGDIELRQDTNVRLQWDQSNLFWNFQATEVTGLIELNRGDSAGNLNVSGGTSSSLGANIFLYAESHASLANDILFRVATSTKLSWDNSATNWNYQGTDIVDINDINIDGRVNRGAASILTCATDAVTITGSRHKIAAESGTADDLATINGASAEGDRLTIFPDTGDTITVKHGTGNIRLNGSVDFAMNNVNDRLELDYDGTNWVEVSRSEA